jgi:hypothetical protein
MFLNPRHIGQVSDVENQSLLGAMARTFHAADPRYPWLVVAALVAAAGLTLAAWAQRHGDEAGGFSLCAVTALLVSPISWSHHWVLAIPALLLAAVAIYRGRARRPVALTVLGTAAILGLAIAGWTRLARSVPGSGWLHLSARALLYSEIYVLAGLAVLALSACSTVTLLARLRGLSMSAELRGRGLPRGPSHGQRPPAPPRSQSPAARAPQVVPSSSSPLTIRVLVVRSATRRLPGQPACGRDHHRVVVHVDHPGVRADPACHLVRVGADRQARAHVDELDHSPPAHVIDGTSLELPTLPGQHRG